MAAGVVKNSDKIVKTTSKRAEFVEEAEKRSPAKKAERGRGQSVVPTQSKTLRDGYFAEV